MSGTDATSCKKCGGSFSVKRIIIDGAAYHERCAVMSYPSHTYEDYARLYDFSASLQARIEELEGALRNVQKLIAEAALTGFNHKDGDWADRLFHSQQRTSATLSKGGGSK